MSATFQEELAGNRGSRRGKRGVAPLPVAMCVRRHRIAAGWVGACVYPPPFAVQCCSCGIGTNLVLWNGQISPRIWAPGLELLPTSCAPCPLSCAKLQSSCIGGCATGAGVALTRSARSWQECRPPPRCPIAPRLRRACGQLGVQIRLPAVLSLGKAQRELSWYVAVAASESSESPWSGLCHRGREHSCSLGTVAAAVAAELQLSCSTVAADSDVATLAASWTSIRCPQRRGIRHPRMMVVNPRRPVLWLVPRAVLRNPGWLESVLSMVDTARIFPPLDRGGREWAPEVPAHQALLHGVRERLKREE